MYYDRASFGTANVLSLLESAFDKNHPIKMTQTTVPKLSELVVI